MIERINNLIEKYVKEYDASLIKGDGFIKTSFHNADEIDLINLKDHIVKHTYLLNPYLEVNVEIIDLWSDSKSLEIYFKDKIIQTTK